MASAGICRGVLIDPDPSDGKLSYQTSLESNIRLSSNPRHSSMRSASWSCLALPKHLIVTASGASIALTSHLRVHGAFEVPSSKFWRRACRAYTAQRCRIANPILQLKEDTNPSPCCRSISEHQACTRLRRDQHGRLLALIFQTQSEVLSTTCRNLHFPRGYGSLFHNKS